MAGFEFPKYPNLKRENPFQDAAGRNPFAEDVPVYDTPSDNLYGASPAATAPAREEHWEPVLADRGRPILRLGASGFLVGLVGLGIGIVARWNDATDLTLLSVLPISLMGLALSVPAVWQAAHDLRAMRVRAMSPEGRRTVVWGWWLGSLGALGSLAVIGIVLLSLISQALA